MILWNPPLIASNKSFTCKFIHLFLTHLQRLCCLIFLFPPVIERKESITGGFTGARHQNKLVLQTSKIVLDLFLKIFCAFAFKNWWQSCRCSQYQCGILNDQINFKEIYLNSSKIRYLKVFFVEIYRKWKFSA